MDLSRTVSEINGNLSRRSQFSLTPVYCTPSLNGFLLSIGAWVKKQNDGAIGPRVKFGDIFSRLDTIYERDRQTDGGRTDRRTPGNSKDHAYA